MSNVIKVDFTEEEESVYKIHDGVLRAVENKASGAAIGSMTPRTFTIGLEGKMAVMDRKEMAEFLWMAAYMVDSERRWCKDKYVGINYPEPE